EQRTALEEHDVPQMQVAVALSHEAVAPARRERLAQPVALAAGPAAQPFQARSVAGRRDDLGEVRERRARDPLVIAESAVAGRRRDGAVEAGDGRGRRVDLLRAETA